MAEHSRPLSPHLQIYKPQLTSVLSIVHRITGVVSFIGFLCVLTWLIVLAWDPKLYGFLQRIVLSWPVQVVLFAWTFSLIYHLCNGIRHLMWDALKGFELDEVYKSGRIVLAVSLILTVLIWVTK